MAIPFPTNNFANPWMPHIAITNNLSNKKNENLTLYQKIMPSQNTSLIPTQPDLNFVTKTDEQFLRS